MEGGSNGSSGGGIKAEKLERKKIEKKRIIMKDLLFQLSSIIPNSQTSALKEYNESGQQDQLLEEATTYIKKLKERVETLELQKKHMSNYMNNGKVTVQVRCLDACMEIVLMSRLMNKSFKLGEVMCILEEEGAEVIHANFSKREDMIMHIIHFQAISSRIGFDKKRMKERLEDLASRWNVVEI
ncbi:hypothetical protein J5N97_005580 [Dioscorea zingiberensis]|uniref:BHLH domain-containing protein n=1 Tax=Dioscorea zingiberensis TaxID=325984 RepID=A0A9D5D996_9LILI|nr:hypothetical protein J5N97_005580 [Dioscorea zingiberensis]